MHENFTPTTSQMLKQLTERNS